MYWHENSQQQSESVIPAEAGIQCLFSSASPFVWPILEQKNLLDSSPQSLAGIQFLLSGMTGLVQVIPFSFLGVQAASLHEEFPCP